jgi:hypothetical protein
MDNSNKMIGLDIRLATDSSITSATITSGHTITQTHDYEGIVETQGSFRYLADEGVPAIFLENKSTGALSTLATPPVFANIRPNFGFESLSRSPDNNTFWTANEEALTVDGPLSSQASGTTVRLLRLNYNFMGEYVPGPQYAYVTEPWHGSAITGARSGVSDLVALPDGRLLVLERSFAFNLQGFFQTRIYEADFSQATDVSPLPGLIGQTFTPVTKRLLYQGDQQNLEGLALGPFLGPGRYALVGIVDDGDPISVNRVVAFDLSGVGPPPCYANCDDSNAPPLLNANDFQCFLNKFAAADSYANCDGSTVAPVLNANDFQCFLGQYAVGCP